MGKKKREQARKPRDEHIYATTAGPVSEIRFSIDERTGGFRFEQEMVNVYSERSYARPKGPKVVSRIPQANPDLSFDETPALLANFDRVCAVDTNSRLVHGRMISATGVVTLHREGIPGPAGLETGWRFDVPLCLQFDELRVERENFGWLTALASLRRRGFFTASDRVGVIVDSDLGNLRAYNERTKPVVEDHFLPPNATLIYASADTGKESLINRALGMADTSASLMLQGLESGVIPMLKAAEPTPIFDGFREIKVNAKEGPLGIARTA
nr:hypothetical protein [uncultured Brevundimonas sp.]